MSLTVPFAELLAWRDRETARWEGWLTRHPAALEVPLGGERFPTVHALATHIVSVELRHAQRILGRGITPPEAIAPRTVEELFELARQARGLIDQFLAGVTPEQLATEETFDTLGMGRVTVTRERILVNIPLHGTRHWAQIATAVRAAGFPAQWAHDYLFSDQLDR